MGDWGPWSLFQREIIDATANVLEACRSTGVGRLLHVSSVTVYGHPQNGGAPITEEAPQGQRLYWLWDYYCRSKIAAEELVRSHGVRATIVRPSWIYGPRDRTSLPRLIRAFKANQVRLIGTGDNLLNVVYVADVADGAIRAANHPDAGGQAFNLASEGELTQRQFVDILAESLEQSPVRRRLPFWIAYTAGFLSEVVGRAIFLKRPPHLTRYVVGLVGRPTRFSIARRGSNSAGGRRSAPARACAAPWPGGISARRPSSARQVLSRRRAAPPPCRPRTSPGASAECASHHRLASRVPPVVPSPRRPGRRD